MFGVGGRVGGGKYGGRGVRKGGGRVRQGAVEWKAGWLGRHQHPNGHWSSSAFTVHCTSETCEGVGVEGRDVGATGIALLSFLGAGHTVNSGYHKRLVRKATSYLMDTQDAASGQIGDPDAHPTEVLDHALATIALSESYGLSKWPMIKPPAQRAIHYLATTQRDDGGWSRGPTGESDVITTAWAVTALVSAESFDLVVDPAVRSRAREFLVRAADPTTGAVGDEGRDGRLPRETAAVLLSRILLGDPLDDPTLSAQAGLISAHPPSTAAGEVDLQYWYFGSYAMYQVGGTSWDRWQPFMLDAVVKSQRQDGDAKGSWDPHDDPAMREAGRVFSTALQALTLEVYYRYDRIVMAR